MKHTNHDFQEFSPHFINKMRKMPILTLDEEYKLAKQWREENDHQAVSKLVESHLRLVSKIAIGYRGYGLPISDLISEGNVGMMQAMKHYDPDKGFRLSTYAMWWIKAAIQEYILRSWSLVRIGTTAGQKKLFFGLRRERKKLSDNHDFGITPEMVTTIAEKLNVREDEVIQMHGRLSSADRSLNMPVSAEGEGQSEWIEWLVDERENQEVELMERQEVNQRKRLLDKAMEHLNERERFVIYERRLKDPAETLDAVAAMLSLSRERVRQIEVKAFEKLQRAMKRLSKMHHHHV